MANTYHLSPYRDNIPDWLKTPSLIILFFLQSFVVGVNGITGSRVASYFGIEQPIIIMFIQFSSIGTVLIIPASYRFRNFFRRSDFLIACMGLQAVVSFICYKTDNSIVLLSSSFLMGMLHIMCVLDLISLLVGRFDFMKDRALFYGVYYGISRTLGQLAEYISLNFVEEYDWKIIFEISAVAALIAIIICFLLFTRERSQHALPLYQMDWSSMILFGVASILFCYTFAMGLTQDWLESPKIWISGILFILLAVLFIIRQYHIKRPYWDLRIFKNFKQIPLGFFLMVLLYIFFSTGILFDRFAAYNFKDMEDYIAKMVMVVVIAYAIGFPLTGWLLYKGFSTRIMVSLGFACYAVSLLYFYQIIQTTLSSNDLIIPYALQGFAYTILLTAGGTFMSVNVPKSHNKDRVMGTIFGRYVIGAFIGSALFSNWLYRGLVRHSAYLSEHTTALDYPFMGSLKNMANGFVARGTGLQTAQEAALEIFKKRETAQAMLMSIKDISLVAGIAALFVAIIMLLNTRLDMHHNVTRSKYRIIPW